MKFNSFKKLNYMSEQGYMLYYWFFKGKKGRPFGLVLDYFDRENIIQYFFFLKKDFN